MSSEALLKKLVSEVEFVPVPGAENVHTIQPKISEEALEEERIIDNILVRNNNNNDNNNNLNFNNNNNITNEKDYDKLLPNLFNDQDKHNNIYSLLEIYLIYIMIMIFLNQLNVSLQRTCHTRYTEGRISIIYRQSIYSGNRG